MEYAGKFAFFTVFETRRGEGRGETRTILDRSGFLSFFFLFLFCWVWEKRVYIVSAISHCTLLLFFAFSSVLFFSPDRSHMSLLLSSRQKAREAEAEEVRKVIQSLTDGRKQGSADDSLLLFVYLTSLSFLSG